MHPSGALRQKHATKINDAAAFAAKARLDEYTGMLARRIKDYWTKDSSAAEAEWTGGERVARTLALMEAEVAARLIHAAASELNMRLLPHGVPHDVEAEVKKRTRGLVDVRVDHDARFGPIPVA